MGGTYRILLATGIAAPILYLVTVAAGGWITEGYSHVDQPVSALFETGAPHALPISLAFVAYNLLMITFGAGLWTAFRHEPPAMRFAAVMVMVNGLFGILIAWAPMDPIGAPATATGIVHLVLAAVLLLSTIAAMAGVARGWWRQSGFEKAARVTAAMLALMLIAGALAAIAGTVGISLLGIYQRLTIGLFLAWLLGLAFFLVSRPAPK